MQRWEINQNSVLLPKDFQEGGNDIAKSSESDIAKRSNEMSTEKFPLDLAMWRLLATLVRESLVR